MDPERWRRIGELFHDALECGADERARFLDDACRGDPALRDEVESLLAHHDDNSAPVVLTPADRSAAEPDDAGAQAVLVGRQFGQYQVTRKLGEGGMGVVHLARDTRLGRFVAIKALPARFTRDEQRRRRLRREARALASLTHPGIATVHALEEFDDTLYLVSEYVRGVTLRQELADGPLPASAVLNTAVEIARALTAAHERHVIHRDLKPENVIRTEDAGIKILDFGLARFSDVEIGAAASVTRLTEPGSAVGTPGYMSPEQIRGQEVDFRSDMFAFGVLLFELTSGLHPFSGGGQASTVARVLEADPPDLTELAPACSPDLERIILRCLQKDADRRYEATRELLDELEAARRDHAERSVRPAAGARGRDRARTTHKPDQDPLWWWQFHQRAAGLVYYAMLYPLWNVRQWAAAPWGTAVFFAALGAVLVAGTLRFHLSFTQRFNPAQIDTQQTQVAAWVRAADWLFVILLLVAAALISSDHAAWASVIAGVGIISCLAFLIIEPATTRAAFQRDGQGAR